MGEELIIASADRPKYAQLREILRTRIEDGEFLPGEAIPSESELVETYGLHRLTVRNAISALIHEGLLKPVQGKGVFVVGKKVQHDLEKLTGFRQKTRQEGAVPETRTLFIVQRPAGLKYAQIFNIAPQDTIYYLRRLYFADQQPVSLDDIYIPTAVISNLENVNLELFSLFEILSFNGIQVATAWQTLSTTRLDAKDARILKTAPETVVLLFECTSCDQNGRVIEFNRSYTLSSRASYTVRYQREPRIPGRDAHDSK